MPSYPRAICAPLSFRLGISIQSTSHGGASLTADGAQVPGPGSSVHDRNRGGADDPRRRARSSSSTRSRACSSPLRGRDQARADGVRARGLDRPVQEHRRGGRPVAGPARAGSRDRGAQEPDDRLGGHAPVRDVGGPADRGAAALPRPGVRAAVRRAPGADLRDARARRPSTIPRRRSTSPTGCACTSRSCSGCRRTPRSGAPRRPGWPRPGRRSSGPSRGWGSRRPTRTGRTTRQRIEFMVNARVIEDYTYLWHDVRPHPNFGTVEVRVMDSQTHVEHTLGIAALVQGLVRELCEHFDAGDQLSRYPFEMLDENKWLAARHGLEGELVDLPAVGSGAGAGARPPADRPDRATIAATSAPRPSSRRSRTARARQRRRAAGRGLRGQPRSARGRGRDRRRDRRRSRKSRGHTSRGASKVCCRPPRPSYNRSGDEHRRPGPVRNLQELPVRGEPVHNGVPVLRESAAQAGPEARSRRPPH